jgi:hypothetical protein
MDILRVPTYPKSTTWEVPDNNADYTIYVEDLVDHEMVSSNVVSTVNSKVTYNFSQSDLLLDRKFLFQILDEDENIVVEDVIDFVRPYVNPNSLGSTASEIIEYTQLEMVARSIIDTIIQDGFYNSKMIVQGVGQGSDYFNVWKKFNKVLKVYENNILIFDFETPDDNFYAFNITGDNSAIQRVSESTYNRVEQGSIILPASAGDLGSVGTGRVVDFPRGYDYIFLLDAGYKTIPVDIEYATKLLIEDLKCGKLDYYKRYVTSYNTDQYKIQFDKTVLNGTGNMIVDKILDKYRNNLVRPGVI